MNQYDEFKKEGCRYSNQPLGEPFLELGAMSLANSYLTEETLSKEEFQCPLSLVRGPESGLIQLSHVVPPDLMFKHYLYVSSTTKTFQDHFSQYAGSVKSKIESIGLSAKDRLAVDIGSNDGLLLKCYKDHGMKAVGVDPATNLAEEANKNGHTTINRYFDQESVQQILREEGKAMAVSANNVFAHIDDVRSVCENVVELLDEQGFFVIEFPYLGVMLEKLYFDMIYHEHLSYIAIHPLRYFLKQFGMEIFDIEEVASHGGSLRVYIKKSTGKYPVQDIVNRYLTSEEEKGYLEQDVYDVFAQKVYKVREDLNECVAELKQNGKRIAGYGAPAKASTIINFCGFNKDQFDYIVDDNPLKQNHFVPGGKMPIVASQQLREDPVDYVLIFAWNFAKEILGKIEDLKESGTKFIVPLLDVGSSERLQESHSSYQIIQ